MRRRALGLCFLPLAGLCALLFFDRAVGSAQPAAAAVTGRVTVRGSHPSDVIVYVAGTQPSARAASRHTKVRQEDLRFQPDLVAVPTGSTVDFPNEDRVFHNVFSLSRTKRFDLGLYRNGESRSVTFNRAGLVDLYC